MVYKITKDNYKQIILKWKSDSGVVTIPNGRGYYRPSEISSHELTEFAFENDVVLRCEYKEEHGLNYIQFECLLTNYK